METLSRQRCLNHELREAVARCPECGFFYCRECITEHEHRVLCAGCLKKITARTDQRTERFAGARRGAQLLAGVFVAWLVFYFIGQMLISIPSEFHEGTLWQPGFLDTYAE
jgi:uncharacterized paraquat-inducible protein A